MAKAKGQTAKVTAAKPAGKPANGMVAKLQDFGKNVGERAKAVGAGGRVAGAQAISRQSQPGSLHCRRSRCGGGCGRNGGTEPEKAGAKRKLKQATFHATCFFDIKKCLVFKRENDFCVGA